MLRRTCLLLLVSLAPLLLPAGASARQAATASVPLEQRIAQLPEILAGEGDYQRYFSAAFRGQVPRAKWDMLMEQIESAIGAPTGIEKVTPSSPWAAAIRIGYEHGIATARIAVDPATPHSVTGLFITGTEPRDDSPAMLDAAFQALPGKAGYGIYALGNDTPQTVREWRGDKAAPIGSSFKLWVLGALSRQIVAGERRWDEVTALLPAAFPSGIVHDWPAGSPMTLHSLATLMISVSDNTATDTLMQLLGRDRIGNMVAAMGTADPDATLPVLTTREAFVLKSPDNAQLLTAWRGASDPAARARLLDQNRGILASDPEPAGFGNQPLATESVEWFASPGDEARALDWLRRNGDEQALGILAVNPGVSADTAARFDYIGYKGGSEPGVIAANFLVRRKDGRWYAVTGNWHRPDAAVEQAKFVGLMQRALNLVAADDGAGHAEGSAAAPRSR
ncbi:serine hydrolase [Stakelama marina]|uniref:Serine hydrolase n=1 Tax=Stakelama marina TaxID=2826939 RepID=A0A8T4IF97_9SPHN|nr:serine hydrolase [Stakelama marina]MBR0553688.1 serine hydrolase [Stakelama marina]